MLRVGVGHREGVDTVQVLAAVIADVRDQIGDTPAAAAIVTISGNFDPQQIASGLAHAYPAIPIVGVTSAGDLSSRIGVSEDAINLLVLACDPGDDIRFSAGLGERASEDPDAAAAAAIEQAAPGQNATLCFAFPDSRRPGTQALITALAARLPRGCALFGGKLGGQFDDLEAPHAQIFGARVVIDSLPVLLCAGAIVHDFRVIQGWTPVGARQVVLALGTCSEGQVSAAPKLAPEPLSPALMARKLRRAETYRVRAEDLKEHSTAMLRTLGAEVDAARVQIAAQSSELRRLYAELEAEKPKSEALLHNILPADVAEELRRTGQVKPIHYDSVTVLFTDFKGFTRVASRMSPAALLRELDFYFSEFDRIIERHGLEKLKTLGDAYMCAGGITTVNASHAGDAVAAAWEIVGFMDAVRADKLASGEPPWELRIGVHTGPLMAGVIGQKKFAYDIWGDTVNIASRLESTGEAGRINLSRTTWEAVRDRWECEHRGTLMAKNRGEIDMYFVTRPR